MGNSSALFLKVATPIQLSPSFNVALFLSSSTVQFSLYITHYYCHLMHSLCPINHRPPIFFLSLVLLLLHLFPLLFPSSVVVIVSVASISIAIQVSLSLSHPSSSFKKGTPLESISYQCLSNTPCQQRQNRPRQSQYLISQSPFPSNTLVFSCSSPKLMSFVQ